MEYRVLRRNLDEIHPANSKSRHRVVPRFLEANLSDAVLRRFHLRAGFTTTSPRALEQTRVFFCDFLRKLLIESVTLMEHDHRMTIHVTDVIRACKHHGIRLYGYDDMCILEAKWGVSEYHVTEMLETNTTFSGFAVEPDEEPTGYFKKTNFAENQKAWDAANADDEYGWSSDSSNEWYSESENDSDSDSDFDSDDENDNDEEPEEAEAEETTPTSDEDRKSRRFLKQTDLNEVFLESLRSAQELVDEQLLIHEPESELMDWDAPIGQGYHSDCDGSRKPRCLEDWEHNAEKEEAKWVARGSVVEFGDDVVDDRSDIDEMNENEDEDDIDHGNEYVIARQMFFEIVNTKLSWLKTAVPLSAVALSAFHNVAEQYLHTALTSGSLKSQIVAIMMEEAALTLKHEILAERQRVKETEAAMVEMQVSFTAKELKMQREIEELKRQLKHRELDSTNDFMKDSKPKRASPGKRKAASTEDVFEDKENQDPSTSSGRPLRSRLNESGLRKKVRLNPI